MIRTKPVQTIATGVFGAALLILTGPALADVKTGVDAWSAGDYARAVAEWRAPAARGDADALFNLAQAYRLGRGVGEDTRQAETLYARAAAQGHLKAADNYGLLLFQDGRREKAIPYISAAAGRGDPRAQYLLGIAHFNGDLVAKDWVRAYALLTLANGAGLPQAGSAIRQMDAHVPLDQRQQAQSLAATMRANADSVRSSRMAAVDLSDGAPVAVGPPDANIAQAQLAGGVPTTRVPKPVVAVAISPSVAAAEAAVSEAMRATGTESPATAGADYARQGVAATVSPFRRPARDVAKVSGESRDGPGSPRSASTEASPPRPSGPWKLQLGAFSVAANAERAWAQVKGKNAMAGKARELSRTGQLTRLLAAGWPSRAEAESACRALKASGNACLVTR